MIRKRSCQFCGAVITDCMGFVNASDFTRLLNGETDIEVREFCGLCDLKMLEAEMVANRRWLEIPIKDVPQGVARGWMAIEQGSAVCGIFEVIAGGTFMLSYHVLGEQKPRVERFPSFGMAQEHANKALTDCKVIPRALPAMSH
jgi:hypothetical protein